MARPKKLQINHAEFSVELSKNETDAMQTNGHFMPDARRIVIDPHLVPNKEREVLLHEAIHAVIDIALLDWKESAEEAVVKSLTGPLLSLIRQNKAFIAYLQE